jgi:adenylylsulfate kinase-like enzyme
VSAGTIWISGLSAAGKTTLAQGLASALRRHDVHPVTVLDGESLRARLDRRFGHSLEHRFAVLEQIIAVAGQHVAAGELVIVATVSHKRQMRQRAREALGPFLEICLRCPVDVCRERDVKAVYARADREYVAGVTEPYEFSPPPAVVIDTAELGIEASVQVAVDHALTFLRAVQ